MGELVERWIMVHPQDHLTSLSFDFNDTNMAQDWAIVDIDDICEAIAMSELKKFMSSITCDAILAEAKRNNSD